MLRPLNLSVPSSPSSGPRLPMRFSADEAQLAGEIAAAAGTHRAAVIRAAVRRGLNQLLTELEVTHG